VDVIKEGCSRDSKHESGSWRQFRHGDGRCGRGFEEFRTEGAPVVPCQRNPDVSFNLKFSREILITLLAEIERRHHQIISAEVASSSFVRYLSEHPVTSLVLIESL
jgi:hypothetical protein